ncbi:type III secretion system effector protein [Salmonella enterica subsp. enterica serovar Paratyphi B]|nr:type III secretion system effector protein [Salmonella enterica subsp. enterica]EDH9995327.1 type III secretion system effector protein [Salmonella enterica subsp. enterica serovar Java]PHM12545.1 type III secretion system effector protein [Salmonella enterica subsp. enterica serovar Paratyphi B]EDI1151386.1 type III secretion system effector protein [Salmonella enterica subsp. enterica serovar Java]HBC0152932.1 T3SS effector NleG family protein [Salmonella enterica subsp. enterica serovar J
MPTPPTFLRRAEHQNARYHFNTQPANINHSLHAWINLCSFQVEAGSFACSEEHLTCPITLDIPTEGVFVKVSSQSDICCLFDKEAFLNLLPLEFAHPLSREKIHIDMIVRKSECFFNTERENFTLR